MGEHPAHWRDSLMGWDFWQDATQYEDNISKELDIALDLDLPKRFPFNLGDEEAPTKGRRRLSMSDVKPPGVRRHSSLTTRASRFWDTEHRARSPSPCRMAPPPMNPFASRISAPGSPPAPRQGRLRPVKPPELPPGITIETRGVSRSPPPSLSYRTEPPVDDFATAAKPFIGFPGGSTWADLPQHKKTLGLDLFRPCPTELDELACLGIEEMRPICQFRHLRSLTITGMLQSYQSYIWQVAWLNFDLEELHLEMSLEPKVHSAIHAAQWKPIQDGWEMDKRYSAEPVYHGHLGDGELHPDIGCGEYLDKHSIEKAKILAMATSRACKRLSIKNLTLSGFVIDADPFLHWFDPEQLLTIRFLGQCLDAGFWLPQAMKVSLRCPRKMEPGIVSVGMIPVDLQKDLKVVSVNEGWLQGRVHLLDLMLE
ncbi:uncharacterized protein N7482_001605 [Penicillium canariense]|uniref:Uncharacterized protein n=1 Tax=Penicillium canariense TaxID=189055 RepID=A0A9W9LT39_9EURO|nr:uncharacterized protein N7482_001605 [Penicillium canariense]KAJ5175728.1 hypothetical protein N7482_001605 [Penicillium canariense]